MLLFTTGKYVTYNIGGYSCQDDMHYGLLRSSTLLKNDLIHLILVCQTIWIRVYNNHTMVTR